MSGTASVSPRRAASRWPDESAAKCFGNTHGGGAGRSETQAALYEAVYSARESGLTELDSRWAVLSLLTNSY